VDGERWERVPTIRASSGMLDVLGVRPFRGRMFLPEEDRPGASGVAMISYEGWQARYGGDPDILGRTIRFEDRAYSIVGILPPRLKIGRTEENELGPPVFWIPVGQSSGSDYGDRASRTYYCIARLEPGTGMQRAAAEVRAILYDAENPSKVGTRLVEWQRDETREARGPLVLLLAGAGLLLLIACTNVATILLGEATSRDHEMAARIALGAGRGRLVRQLLTESVTLATLGGALGIAAAWIGTRALVALAPADIPGIGDVAVDGRVIAVAVLTLTASGIAFGLVPALTLSRAGPAALLKVGPGQSVRGRGAMQRALVASELALSVVLLTGAGLLARSFHNITSVDPGFRPDNLVYVNSILPRAVLSDSDAVHRIYDAAAARLGALGGVAAVGVVTDPPFIGGVGATSFTIEGETSDAASRGTPVRGGTRRHRARDRAVSPGSFRLLGIPVIAGREFTPMDRQGAAGVAVVSAALARRDFPTGSPIGRRVWQRGQWRTIVGVVGDVLEGKLTGAAEPAFYTPIAQRGDVGSPSLIVKWSGTTPSVAMLQDALRQADSRLVVTGVHSSRDLVERSFAADRFRAMLMSVFGILAALLSTIGMYGVTARAVAWRTREVGIRLALGATPPAVVGNLMRGTLAGAAAGVIAGLGIALLATRLLSPFLFGITPADPATYAAIVALLALTAALASWLPARGAGRLDVAKVLRAE
jgi:putative ABC transport system permease protein